MAVKYKRAYGFRESPTPGPASRERVSSSLYDIFLSAQRPSQALGVFEGWKPWSHTRITIHGPDMGPMAHTWATWNLNVTKLMCYEHMYKVNRALRVEREVSMVHGAMEVRP